MRRSGNMRRAEGHSEERSLNKPVRKKRTLSKLADEAKARALPVGRIEDQSFKNTTILTNQQSEH